MRWKSLWRVHREFPYESPTERILKIGPHLPETAKKEKGFLIYLNTVYITCFVDTDAGSLFDTINCNVIPLVVAIHKTAL